MEDSGTMELSDADLVAQCLDGRKDAFGELVRRYQDPVFNLAFRMTGNRAEAEDLAQEAFLRAYRKLAQYRPEYAFRNWVMTICANQTKNFFRRAVRRRRAEETHLELAPHPAGRDGPAYRAFEEALARVPDALRVPLVLKHVEGFSYEEVADTLRIGISAAKMRVKRGRDELIRILRADKAEVRE
jgi:RNA polymerase sigma-70 factor (ECF subfamily)